MTIGELIEFWQQFCEREQVAACYVSAGESAIYDDPEYWQANSMWNLLANVCPNGINWREP